MSKHIERIIVGFISAMLAMFMFQHIMMPRIIRDRMDGLNLTQYHGGYKKMIVRDSVCVDKSGLYYLQHGTMKGYSYEY